MEIHPSGDTPVTTLGESNSADLFFVIFSARRLNTNGNFRSGGIFRLKVLAQVENCKVTVVDLRVFGKSVRKRRSIELLIFYDGEFEIHLDFKRFLRINGVTQLLAVLRNDFASHRNGTGLILSVCCISHRGSRDKKPRQPQQYRHNDKTQ